MNVETCIAYVIACAILSVIPGPSVLLITGQALTKGLRAAFYCLVGETLGGAALILLSLLGVGAVLAGLILAIYALVASQARDALKGKKAKRTVGYASGGFYLGGSVLMATTK